MAALLRKPLVPMLGLAADALGFSEYDSMHSFPIIGTVIIPIGWTIVCFLGDYYHSFFMPTGTCFTRIPVLIV